MATRMDADESAKLLAEQSAAYDKNRISIQQKNAAVTDARASLKGYSAELKASTDQLKKSIVGLGSSMLEGKEGASVYTNTINSTANAIDSYAQKYGALGIVFGKIAKGLGKLAGAAAKQADALFDSYKEMSRSGLATGMDDTFKNLQDMGYTIKELGMMSALLKENSEQLANLGGTAAAGTAKFAEAAKDIQNSEIGDQFKQMGMTVDDVNAGVATYIKMQQLSGSTQKQTHAELAASAAEFIEQQDKLAKITGLNAKQQNAAYEQQIAQQQFGIKQYELKKAAEAGDKAAEAEFNRNADLVKIMTAKDPATAADMAKFLSGGLNSDEAQRFLRSFPEMAKALQSGEMDSKKLMAMAGRDADSTLGKLGDLAKSGVAEKYSTSIPGLMKIKGASLDKIEAAGEKANEQQRGQQAGVDTATASMVKNTTSQRNATQSLDKLTNVAIKPTVATLSTFAKAVENVTDVAGKIGGREGRIGGGATALGGAVTAVTGAGAPAAVPAATKPAPAPAATPAPAPAAAPAPAPAPAATKPAPSAVPVTKATGKGGMPAGADDLLKLMNAAGINDKAAQANVLAQIQAESKGVPQSESLKYSAKRLLDVFPKYFKNLEDAQAVAAGGEKAIGDRIYGGRMGNAGDEGYMYRGRGLIQLTGKDNYAKYGKMIGVDLVKNPDLANDPEVAQKLAIAFFKDKQSKGTNLGDINSIGKSVGYVDRGGKETEHRAQLAQQISGNMQQAATGGILSGPNTGFEAMLHGTEAVIPLPDGKTIPVQMSGGRGSSAEQMKLISMKISKLDTLVRSMQTHYDTTNKILQRQS